MNKLPALTGLRFFAAFLVVYSHFGQYALPSQIAPTGYLGVSFFYLLSGFILAYTYLDGAALRGTAWSFYVARFARIYPAYFLGLVLYILAIGWWHAYADPRFALIDAQHPTGVLLSSLTLTQAWVPWWGDVINPPATTLSCEALFYALFPLLAPALARLRTRQMLLALAWLYALEIAPAYLAGGNVPLDTHWLLWYNPAGRTPEFLCGVCLGILFLRHRQMVTGWYYARVLTLLGCAGAVCALFVASALPIDAGIRGAVDPAFWLLIYGAAWGSGRLAAWFSLPRMVLLGEASYALYILHYPVWEWLAHGTTPAEHGLIGALYFLAYAALTLLLALVTLQIIETPARRWLRAKLQPHRR